MTYYEVLGVSQAATSEDIKRAFGGQIKRWHPDVNGGSLESNECTKFLVEAREVLLDPNARAEYDRSLRSSSVGVGAGSARQTSGHGGYGGPYHSRQSDSSTSAYQRARARAANQAGRPLDDWLRGAWQGDSAFSDFLRRLFATLQVGALTYLTIGVFALSATGVLAPFTIPLGLILSRTIMGMLFVRGRWVGVKMILQGLWLFPVVLAIVIGLLNLGR